MSILLRIHFVLKLVNVKVAGKLDQWRGDALFLPTLSCRQSCAPFVTLLLLGHGARSNMSQVTFQPLFDMLDINVQLPK